MSWIVIPVYAAAVQDACVLCDLGKLQSPVRERVVADFLVGAHAMLQCDALITRDAGFFRDFFKGLKVIQPTAP